MQKPDDHIGRIFVTPRDLSGILENAWAIDLSVADTPTRIIPDPNVELVVLYDDVTGPDMYVTGPLFSASLPPRQGYAIGAGLRPEIAASVLRCDLMALRSLATPVKELGWFPELSGRPYLSFEDGIAELFTVVRRRCSALEVEAHQIVANAVRHFEAYKAPPRLKELASVLGTSQRTLTRRFSKNLGVSPKTILRLYRVRRVLTALHARPKQSLAELATEYGFFDQSHLTLDLCHFTGMAPAALKRFFS